jgi:hypothetical protein
MISPSKPDSSTLLPPSDDDPTTETFDDDANADAQSPTATLADEPDAGEGGKLKMIIQIVKRSLGVKDLAAMYVVPYPPLRIFGLFLNFIFMCWLYI